jgi:hypothetical protein
MHPEMFCPSSGADPITQSASLHQLMSVYGSQCGTTTLTGGRTKPLLLGPAVPSPAVTPRFRERGIGAGCTENERKQERGEADGFTEGHCVWFLGKGGLKWTQPFRC